MGFDADGRRSGARSPAGPDRGPGRANQAARGDGPRKESSRSYTVNEAVADWLAKGLPAGRSAPRTCYDYAVGHLLKKFGSRPLSDLSAGEVRAALESLTGQLSTRTLGIARLSLERAIRFAQADDRVGKNVRGNRDPAGRSAGHPRACPSSRPRRS